MWCDLIILLYFLLFCRLVAIGCRRGSRLMQKFSARPMISSASQQVRRRVSDCDCCYCHFVLNVLVRLNLSGELLLGPLSDWRSSIALWMIDRTHWAHEHGSLDLFIKRSIGLGLLLPYLAKWRCWHMNNNNRNNRQQSNWNWRYWIKCGTGADWDCHQILFQLPSWASNCRGRVEGKKREIIEIDWIFAGHPVHEMTTYCSTASIFRFLDDKLKAATS